jgi:hypothetical protein
MAQAIRASLLASATRARWDAVAPSRLKSIARARNASHVCGLIRNLILLDRILAKYGPDAAPARDLLRRSVAPMVERIWRENGSDSAQAAPFEPNAAAEAVYGGLQELLPRNDAERSLQARAIQIGAELAQTRLLPFTETGNSTPRPFLVILVFWLTIIFPSFSLFARLNLTVIAAPGDLTDRSLDRRGYGSRLRMTASAPKRR